MQNQYIPNDSDRFCPDFLKKILPHDFIGALGTFYLRGLKKGDFRIFFAKFQGQPPTNFFVKFQGSNTPPKGPQQAPKTWI